jgi:nucleoside-diphosphate-sugar epimerase
MEANVLVTGAAGYTGTMLIEWLSEIGVSEELTA